MQYLWLRDVLRGVSALVPVLVVAACAGSEEPSPGSGGSASTVSASATSSAGGSTTATGTGGAGTGGAGGAETGGAGGDAGGGGMGGAACGQPGPTADHPVEAEPNDQLATANSLAGAAKGFSAAICPVGDVDVFAVDVAAGESLTVAVTDGNGGCPATAEPDVQILDPMDQIIAEDTGFGCTVLAPQAFPVLSALAQGTYHVRVANYEQQPISPYVIDILALPPGCGDSVVQPANGEQCDDGNAQGGDGCTASCQLESGDFVNEVEVNDTQATANALGPGQGAVGAIEPLGDVDFYAFDITVAGSSVSALVSDGFGACPTGFDSFLWLYDPSSVPIAQDDDAGTDACSWIDPASQPGATALAPGTYALAVGQSGGLSTQAYYVLTVEVHLPGCGDGVLAAGEQCDDGNFINGDGCSATCNAEPPWEIEPNGSLAEATPPWINTTFWSAHIEPIADHDWFSFDVPQGANVTLSTNDLGNVASCANDTLIHLVDDQGNEITMNDNGGVGPCSKLEPVTDPAVTAMAAGTYYVWVQEFFDSSSFGYELHLTIQ